MSMNLNLCVFSGNLGKDPECSVINGKNGQLSMAKFSVGVKRNKDVTDWVNLTAFGSKADFIQKYFKKGSGILVESEYQVDPYQDKEGNQRYATGFVVTDVKFPPMAGNKPVDATGGGSPAIAEGFTPIADTDEAFPWAQG